MTKGFSYLNLDIKSVRKKDRQTKIEIGRQTKMETALGSWCEFDCHDDANAWRKFTEEADKHKNFLLQFRK